MDTMKKVRLGIFALICCHGAAMAGEAPSVASAWVVESQAETRLIAAANGVAPGQQGLSLGWQVALSNGWKTYWRDPGEAGLPPKFDWSKSTNVAAVDVSWPMPVRYSLYGIETAVYQGGVVLPLAITLKNPGQAATIAVSVEYMVCKDVCVPLAAEYTLTLPAKQKPLESQENILIRSYAAAVPTVDQAQFSVRRLVFDAVTSALVVDLQLMKPNRKVTDIFVAGPDSVAFGRAKPVSGKNGNYQVSVMGRKAAEGLQGQNITLIVADDEGVGYSWTGPVAPQRCLDPTASGC